MRFLWHFARGERARTVPGLRAVGRDSCETVVRVSVSKPTTPAFMDFIDKIDENEEEDDDDGEEMAEETLCPLTDKWSELEKFHAVHEIAVEPRLRRELRLHVTKHTAFLSDVVSADDAQTRWNDECDDLLMRTNSELSRCRKARARMLIHAMVGMFGWIAAYSIGQPEDLSTETLYAKRERMDSAVKAGRIAEEFSRVIGLDNFLMNAMDRPHLGRESTDEKAENPCAEQ